MTLNDSWGYNAADDNWKDPRQVIHYLVRCVGGGGNFLLNVGPKADGTIPRASANILRKVGQWVDRNQGAIYGAGRSPFRTSTGLSTVKGNTLYMHVLRWPGGEIHFGGIKNRVRSASLLDGGKELKVQQEGDRVTVRGLSRWDRDKWDTVIVLELEGEPEALDYFEDGWSPALSQPAEEAPDTEEEEEDDEGTIASVLGD